ncbi:hypothetical protein TREMEDRAFT_74838 [Tremella mesenterica DSM 1558]|uniref:uncharacterized protein n=1 Tax=Tremella mesenterica (strain ATCC 24925 / CBS 8224 / DSM 1558 / NBRC 9311 / NRRL Y-6157 / RJB 2259-6 / UBC 559-6) TaxID=578456 RepID=UPI00032C3F86|nr:uncharacterized protein TREMEDRAFT_74838 [Tremella mesenterica DSM 1558]EIW66015.1 hypothetical protein TREMEDRAFT_74838 [Tremella mesenterica DSM 1558]
MSILFSPTLNFSNQNQNCTSLLPAFDVFPGEPTSTFEWQILIENFDPEALEALNILSSMPNTPSGGPDSAHSSPPDFAFAPPSDTPFDAYRDTGSKGIISMSPSQSKMSSQTVSTPTSAFASAFSIPSSYSMPNYFPGSSFSSIGSVTGSSFSSAELPPISHEFARPSTNETRRPATAGGALQSGWNMNNGISGERFQRIGRSATATVDGKSPVDTIHESTENSNMFSNPFSNDNHPHGETDQNQAQTQVPDSAVDPHFNPNVPRRSSESAAQANQHQWNTEMLAPPHSIQPMGLSSAPSHITHFNLVSQLQSTPQNQLQASFSRPHMGSTGRPQTSDGIPGFTGLHSHPPLPPARTIVNQVYSQNSPYTPYAPQMKYPSPTDVRASGASSSGPIPSNMPFRDSRLSMPEITHPPNNFPGNRAYSIDSGRPMAQSQVMRAAYHGKSEGQMNELTFVPLGGPAPKKRPRRRFDEIERLYHCGWNGCEKSYGTLNHLNAHVAMQKHGEKRLPAEFKEMRRVWRKKKREAASSAANAQYMSNSNWNQALHPQMPIHRPSVTSSSSAESDYDRRDSALSMLSSDSFRPSIPGNIYTPGSLPSASTVSYQWGETPSHLPPQPSSHLQQTQTPLHDPTQSQSRPTTTSSVASSVPDNRPYISSTPYGHTPLQTVSARRPSGQGYIPMPMTMSNQNQTQFRQSEADHSTPTPQNPFQPPQNQVQIQQNQGQSQVTPPNSSHGNQTFPFQTLASPMHLTPGGVGAGTPYNGSQFAFQR